MPSTLLEPISYKEMDDDGYIMKGNIRWPEGLGNDIGPLKWILFLLS